MKLLRFILSAFINAYKPSADPNLFGSKKLNKVAGMARARADETQGEIDKVQSGNPFESAAAKSAMTKASQTSKQMQTRMLNTMGNNASPEALIAAQGNLNQSTGSVAGQIATGAEENKQNEIMRLRGLKEQQMGEYGNQKGNAINAVNQGFGTVFKGIDSVGGILEGIGGVKTAFNKG